MLRPAGGLVLQLSTALAGLSLRTQLTKENITEYGAR